MCEVAGVGVQDLDVLAAFTGGGEEPALFYLADGEFAPDRS